MNHSKREIKENAIIEVAEKVFSSVGYSNAKMESIAKEVGVSKGTVYFYFNSKENLYMAVTYKAFQTLLNMYYQCVEDNKSKNGYETVMAIMKAYLEFASKYYYSFELLMNYMSLIRANSLMQSDRISEAMRQSLYFRKIQDIHNLPLNIVVKELKRGQEDGSVLNKRNPIMLYLTAWAVVIGYTSLNITSAKSGRTTIFKVVTKDWQEYILQLIHNILMDASTEVYNAKNLTNSQII